jgi:hypothetical protein
MSPESAKFYHRVFNRANMNIYAVRTGLFDTLFCDTEDPRVFGRWEQALPKIVEIIDLRAKKWLEGPEGN